jgi:nitronate monooxygenase
MSDTKTRSATALLDLLGQLLEGERAGARGVAIMSRLAKDERSRAALGAIARDEARFCAMLSRHITRLGGEPSAANGAFYDKLLAIEDARQRLDFLDRGQGWVVRTLREALPGIDDAELHADLTDMLETHERNIARSQALR